LNSTTANAAVREAEHTHVLRHADPATDEGQQT
jgi:hypothetical protein